jgi:hypothetical protein
MELSTVPDASRELRAKARKYRELARWVTDHSTTARILAFTNELEQRAMMMERPSEDDIRARARELWEQAGKPEGRDEEFWHRAEKELKERTDPSFRTPDNL